MAFTSVRINIAPLMLAIVLLILGVLWLDNRERLILPVRLAGDAGVLIAFVILLHRGIRGPAIRFNDIHKALRLTLAVALICGIIAVLLSVGSVMARWLSGG